MEKSGIGLEAKLKTMSTSPKSIFLKAKVSSARSRLFPTVLLKIRLAVHILLSRNRNMKSEASLPIHILTNLCSEAILLEGKHQQKWSRVYGKYREALSGRSPANHHPSPKRTMGRLPSPTRSITWSEHRAKMESVTLMIRAIDKTMYCERDPMKTSRTTWWPFQPGLNQQITAPDDDPAASAPGPFPMTHHVLTLPHWHHL